MKKSILIIEDDQEIREVLRIALEIEGYNLITYSNGLEALEYLKASPPPNLILLDLMMPKMSGYEFTKNTSMNDSLKNIPIVVLTAARNAPRPEGIVDYIKKPVDLEVLTTLVKQHCS